ncbi:MAG: hypothetical protein U0271_16280 [Polyangiaceae bacterium]
MVGALGLAAIVVSANTARADGPANTPASTAQATQAYPQYPQYGQYPQYAPAYAPRQYAPAPGTFSPAGEEKPAAPTASGGMSSPGMFGTGLLFTLLGIAGLGAGGYYYGQGAGACDGISMTAIPTPEEIAACQAGVIQQAGGVVGLVIGGAFVVSGIPLMIAGGIPESAPAQPQVALDVGAGSARLTVKF